MPRATTCSASDRLGGLLGVVTGGHGAHPEEAGGDGDGALLIGFTTSEQAGQCVADIIGAASSPAAWR